MGGGGGGTNITSIDSFFLIIVQVKVQRTWMVGGDLSRESMAVPITVLQEKDQITTKFSGSTLPTDPQLSAKTDLNQYRYFTVVKQKLLWKRFVYFFIRDEPVKTGEFSNFSKDT